MSLISNSNLAALHCECKSTLLVNNHKNRDDLYRHKAAIPPPAVFDSLGSNPRTSLPQISECATHLLLLETFFALRLRIINSEDLDKSLATEHTSKIVYRKRYNLHERKWYRDRVSVKDSDWGEKRRGKWPLFLHIAVARFMSWAGTMDAALESNSMLPSGSENRILYMPPLGMLTMNTEYYTQDTFANIEERRAHGLARFPTKPT